MKKDNKILYLEFMRILACFFVIFNHTKTDGFFLFSIMEKGSMAYYLYMAISIFCKFAVPVFFAISGILLLNKEESIKEIIRKRILKILILLIFFLLFYYLNQIRIGKEIFDLKRFITELIGYGWNYSFWYLYAYLAFLISLPILRNIAKNLTNENYKYLILLNFIFHGLVNVVKFLFFHDVSINSSFSLSHLFSNIFIYPLIGYYIHYRCDLKEIEKNIVGIWLINILSIILTVVTTDYHITITNTCDESTTQLFYNSFVLINCITLMMSARLIFSKIKLSNILERIISNIGSLTLGIYIMHIFVIKNVNTVHVALRFMKNNLRMNSMIAVLIQCLIIMIISGITTKIIKFIPGIKKIV